MLTVVPAAKQIRQDQVEGIAMISQLLGSRFYFSELLFLSQGQDTDSYIWLGLQDFLHRVSPDAIPI